MFGGGTMPTPTYMDQNLHSCNTGKAPLVWHLRPMVFTAWSLVVSTGLQFLLVLSCFQLSPMISTPFSDGWITSRTYVNWQCSFLLMAISPWRIDSIHHLQDWIVLSKHVVGYKGLLIANHLPLFSPTGQNDGTNCTFPLQRNKFQWRFLPETNMSTCT